MNAVSSLLRTLASACVICMLVNACGQRGPLYLPSKPAPATPAQPATDKPTSPSNSK